MSTSHFRAFLLFVAGFLLCTPSALEAAPLILAQPTNQTAFAGDASVNFDVWATATPAPTYQWQVLTGGTGTPANLTGETSSRLTLSNPTVDLNGNKYCCVVTSAGALTSATARLNVSSAPTLTPGVTVTPASAIATSSTNLTIQITGLSTSGTTGDTVRIERFLDLNGNGVADIGEPLVASILVTDGQNATIGGMRNPAVPGDDDTTRDGTITTHLALQTASELAKVAGTYLIRVSSPSGAFRAVQKTHTLTQPAYGPSVSGKVTSGTSGVPNAIVFAMNNGGQGGPVALALADSAGNYTLNVPAGSYSMIATATGYAASMSAAPGVTLSGSQALSDINPSLVAATCTLAGQLQDISGSPSLKGVQVIGQGAGGYLAVTFSDAGGNYVLGAVAGQWGVDISSQGVGIGLLGYVAPNNGGTSATTTEGLSTALNLQFSPATALVYGTVKDSTGTPIPGVTLGASYNSGAYWVPGITDASGNYALGVLGNSGVWSIGPDNSSDPAWAGLVAPNYQNFTATSGSATQVNLTAQKVTAHLQGTVTKNGVGVSGATVGASLQNGNGTWISTTTGPDGSYDLGVSAGTWNLSLDSNYTASNNLVTPEISTTIADGQTLSGMDLQVLDATGTISGSVKDSGNNPLTQANVYANATINGVNYFANANTDNSGNYSLPVINGTWDVGVNSSISFTQQTVAVSGSSTTVNFTPPPIVAHLTGTMTKNGVAVSGAIIGASLQAPPYTWLTTTTGTDGSFDLGVTSNGPWNVNVEQTYANSNNLVGPMLPQTVANNQSISNIAYPIFNATGTISGSVKDSNNNPLTQNNVYANATINGLSYNVNAQTNGSGNYSFPVISGTWTVGVNSSLNFSNQTVTVSGSSTTVDFAPPPIIAHLTGKATIYGGGASGVVLNAWLQTGMAQGISVTTGTDGSFDIGVTSNGTWGINIASDYADRSYFVGRNLSVTVSNSQSVSDIAYPILIASGMLNGSVKDASGNPLPNTTVWASAMINGNDYFQTAMTGTDGNYSRLPLISGTWTVGVNSPLNFVQQTVPFTGSGMQVNFTAPAVTAHLQGTVTHNGAPISGVMIQAFNATQVPRFTTTDSNGNFDLGVTADTWYIEMDSNYGRTNGLVAPTLTRTIADGQTLSGISYSPVDPTATLHGSVKDANNAPQANQTVEVHTVINSISYYAEAITDSNGNYSLPSLSGAVWSVGINWSISGRQTVTVSGSTLLNFGPMNLWQQNFFNATELGNPSISGLAARVPTGAPLTNLMAYALGVDPHAASVRNLPLQTIASASGTSYMVFNFTRNTGATDATYTVEANTNLANSGGWTSLATFSNGAWSPAGVVTESGTAPNLNVQVWDSNAPVQTATKRFLRLRVTH